MSYLPHKGLLENLQLYPEVDVISTAVRDHVLFVEDGHRFFGNPKQLGPTIISAKEENPFGRQISLLLLSRIMINDWEAYPELYQPALLRQRNIMAKIQKSGSKRIGVEDQEVQCAMIPGQQEPCVGLNMPESKELNVRNLSPLRERRCYVSCTLLYVDRCREITVPLLSRMMMNGCQGSKLMHQCPLFGSIHHFTNRLFSDRVTLW